MEKCYQRFKGWWPLKGEKYLPNILQSLGWRLELDKESYQNYPIKFWWHNVQQSKKLTKDQSKQGATCRPVSFIGIIPIQIK